MRLTLTTLRGGTVYDDEPPSEAAALLTRYIPAGRSTGLFEGAAASTVASELLRDLLATPPSPRLIVLMTHLQTIEHREKSRIVVLR